MRFATQERIAVREFECVDSTNRLAARICADETVTHPLWIRANQQTDAVGRRARRWESLENNLNATLILPVSPEHPLPPLSFIAALSVHTTVVHLLEPVCEDFQVALKWPNDVLLNGCKVCGILLEALNTDGAIGTVLVGIGINLNASPLLEDMMTAYIPVSLRKVANTPICVVEAMTCLTRAFANLLAVWEMHGTAHIMQMWRQHAVGLGKHGIARLQDETIDGYFRAVTDDGTLLMETEDGERRIHAADIFVLSQ